MLTTILLAATLLAAPAPSAAPQLIERRVEWFEQGVQAALGQARLQNKLTMIFFHAEWNQPSQTMLQNFATDKVAVALDGVFCVKVDFDKQRDVADRYAVLDSTLPVVVWMNADGTPRDRIDRMQAADVFLANTARIKADIGTINDLRRKVAADGNDLESRFELYRRLRSVGDAKGAEEQKAAIQKLDAAGTSRGSRHFKYKAITDAIEQHWARTKSLDMQKVGELQTFVEAETDSELVWDGWMRLSNTHEYFANLAKQQSLPDDEKKHRALRREFLSYAWRGVPPDRLEEWFGLAGAFWDQRDDLSQQDKDFFVAMSGRLAQVFEGEARAHDLRARALSLVGRREDALAAAKKALEIEPGNELYKNRVKTLGGG